MAGFSFASGNAKKLAALPLYALGRLASALVPRSPDRWVFGCGSGIGEGSLAMFRHVQLISPRTKTTWLARDERERAIATALGIPVVVKSSARGFWLTLRAGVVVVTHGFGDANRYASHDAFIAQLWHGIPLKLIQLDSPATLGVPAAALRLPIVGRQIRGLLRAFYRRGFGSISLMPAASELVATRLRTAFGLSADQVAVTGDPRDDVLSRGTLAERSAAARELLFGALGITSAASGILAVRIILFAPTWRDGEADPALPTSQDWAKIDSWLQQNKAILVVRPHPLGVGDYSAGTESSDRVHLLTSRQQSDVNPILAAADALVTDYSSIAFDYSLTGRPVFFIAPDQDTYTRTRGLYEPYRSFSGGREAFDWTTLLTQFSRFDEDAAWASTVLAHTETLRDRHFAYHDGHNTVRVYDEILRRLKAHK